jgi:hypothetical protein
MAEGLVRGESSFGWDGNDGAIGRVSNLNPVLEMVQRGKGSAVRLKLEMENVVRAFA